ncbi:hypothetical protein Tco_0587603, partial [Tanacetum coccineum]
LTTEMELSTIAKLTSNSTNKMLEAKVNRKCIAKSPPKMTPYAFCYILLDQEGASDQLAEPMTLETQIEHKASEEKSRLKTSNLTLDAVFDLKSKMRAQSNHVKNQEPHHQHPLQPHSPWENKKKLKEENKNALQKKKVNIKHIAYDFFVA